jgi:hypothetical protein
VAFFYEEYVLSLLGVHPSDRDRKGAKPTPQFRSEALAEEAEAIAEPWIARPR